MTRILLVDDDRTNSNLTKMLLEMDGFVVTISPDITRTIEALKNSFDALIIDCNLARGDDGIDLLKAIRAGETEIASNVPIIMTSGDDRRASEADKGGANTFLLKPYPPSTLSAELSDLLAGDKSRG